jgi:hypothetical protein
MTKKILKRLPNIIKSPFVCDKVKAKDEHKIADLQAKNGYNNYQKTYKVTKYTTDEAYREKIKQRNLEHYHKSKTTQDAQMNFKAIEKYLKEKEVMSCISLQFKTLKVFPVNKLLKLFGYAKPYTMFYANLVKDNLILPACLFLKRSDGKEQYYYSEAEIRMIYAFYKKYVYGSRVVWSLKSIPANELQTFAKTLQDYRKTNL